jgi:hypothetical protein
MCHANLNATHGSTSPHEEKKQGSTVLALTAFDSQVTTTVGGGDSQEGPMLEFLGGGCGRPRAALQIRAQEYFCYCLGNGVLAPECICSFYLNVTFDIF